MNDGNDDVFRDRLGAFREAEERFFSGGSTPKEYNSVAGGFGSYSQRGGERGMIRLRLCGGRLDKDKLDFIVAAATRHSVDRIHTTTCECIQLHNLVGDQIMDIMEGALDHGINTQGAGGDHPRNVSATSLSGVEPGEFFDVYPYAKEAEGYLLRRMLETRLPRKLKVTFSSSTSNETHATFRDLGFVARPDGLFDVWSAGGLGNNPRMGCLVSEAVDPGDTLYHVAAMVDVFTEHGDYDDRTRARTRYIKDAMGEGAYRDAYLDKLGARMASGGMGIRPDPIPVPVKEPVRVTGDRIHPQRQEGLYYVTYRPVGGDVELRMLSTIADTIRDMEGVELRVSPDSAIHVVNLSGPEALRVSEVTAGGASNRFESSVSCIGGSICSLGVRDSNGLLRRMISAVREAGIGDDSLPRFRISGCPSSCGAHQVGVVGLQGGSATVDGVPVPAYRVFVNGCGLQGRERFGDLVGTVPEGRVPEMVVAIGRAVDSSGMGFDGWLVSREGILADVVSAFTV
ncbi:MAG: nitrite/sulfite reductase [Candidatus Methanomethylophilaceae archaeon]|nr:nitrite/sulfite reductase [Candidatus Methanomethylophilaceae archaeon]